MSNSYEPKREVIGALLSNAGGTSFEVPEYQRPYSWKKTELEAFWQDLTAFDAENPGDHINEKEYFLGSIVAVKQEGSRGSALLLLDGQQRLATATILFSAFRDKLHKLGGNAASRMQARHIADFDDYSNSYRPVLSLNVHDRDFFKEEIQITRFDGETEHPKPEIASHGRIRTARLFFEERIDEHLKDVNEASKQKEALLRLAKVLAEHVSVVIITSGNEDAAATIFETLNDRGVGLSTVDLLRNHLLRETDPNDRPSVIKAWETIFDNTGENSERYLRHFWVSHFGDEKARRLYRVIKVQVGRGSVNGNPKWPALDFTKKLASESSIYKAIVDSDVPDQLLADELNTINDLSARALYPALLAAFAASDGTPAFDLQLKDFVHQLASAFVRHQYIGNLDAASLESLSFEIAKTVRQDGLFDLSSHLKAFLPSLDSFAVQFAVFSPKTNKAAQALLRPLEATLRPTSELHVSEQKSVHLEHIYPKKPTMHWHDHDEWVNRLGNMTLLSSRFNRSISNSEFRIKLERGFLDSDLLLTQQLGKYTEWNEAAISSRQFWLAEIAARTWALPGERHPSAEDISKLIAQEGS